jgi:hypothetical protein
MGERVYQFRFFCSCCMNQGLIKIWTSFTPPTRVGEIRIGERERTYSSHGRRMGGRKVGWVRERGDTCVSNRSNGGGRK